MNIEEDYVSFEIANLLKDKGFDEPTIGTYYKDGSFEYLSLNKWNSKFITPISAPTIQMAIKWLREVYDVHISIMYNDRYAYPYEFHIIKQHYASKSDMNRYTTYEECAEKAVKFCLENLI